MFIKNLYKCKEIIAGDNTVLREILNPFNDKISINYSLAHAKIKPGEKTFKHRLKMSELYYIIEGQGTMYIDNEEEKVSSGDAIYIPPGSVQSIKNTGREELVFLCIVEPPWKEEGEEILE